MEIKINTTKEDHINFYKYFYFNKRRIITKIFIAFIIPIILFGGKFQETAQFETIQWDNFLKIISLAIFIFSLITFLPYYYTTRRFISVLRTSQSYVGELKFILTDTGIQVATETENNLLNWENIRLAGISDKVVFFLLYTKRVYVLPIKYFTSEKDILSFVECIRRNVLQVKDKKSQRKLNRIYWWGLLGLLPNFGLIAGLILLYKGLVTYKDKKLIIIGIADILFTVVFWLVFRHEMNHGNWFAEAKAKEAQSELNSLVKNIEFYKVQNGVYPYNIEQIENTEQMIWVYDPLLQTMDDKQQAKFHYKIIRDKYTLFSVGIDRIPNTSDDIYPTVTKGTLLNLVLLKNNNGCLREG